MKKLIYTLLLFIPLFAQAQSYKPTGIPVFNNIADLKKQTAVDSAIVYVAGGTNVSDFRGSFYRYLASSTADNDLTYFNVVQPTGINTGRWIRLNQTTIPYPQGTLFRIGLLKIFTATGTTDANGEVTFNLTTDNTSNGTSIFSSIVFNNGMATTPAATPNDVTFGSIKSQTAKTVTYRFSRGALGVLGLATLAAAANNTPVSILILGL